MTRGVFLLNTIFLFPLINREKGFSMFAHLTKLSAALVALLTLTACIEESSSDSSDRNNVSEQAQTILFNTPLTGSLNIQSDTEDFYHFNVTEPTNVLITLSGPSNTDFDLTLFNSQRVELANSWGLNSTESISEVLQSGEYYIMVDTVSGSGSYELEVENLNTSPGSDLNVNEYTILMNTSPTGYLAMEDDFDLYIFNLTSTTTITATLSGPSSADFDLALTDEYANLIESSTGTNSYESITRTLQSGIYALVVNRYSGSGSYTISLSN